VADAALTTEVVNYPLVKRVITASSAAGGNTLKWTVDKDCNLVAFIGQTGAAVISFDPAITYATFIAPPADVISDNFATTILYMTSLIPLHQGDKIYLAFAPATPGVVQLFLDS
jgi:hypothetical protein